MRIWILVGALLAASCAAGPQRPAGGYPTLEAAYLAQNSNHPSSYTDAEWVPVKNCLAPSVVTGIPAADQAAMLKGMNARRITPEVDLLIQKWMGVSLLGGKPMKPDPTNPATFSGGKLHYANGQVVADRTPENTTRILDNAKAFCPEIVTSHPDIFKMFE